MKGFEKVCDWPHGSGLYRQVEDKADLTPASEPQGFPLTDTGNAERLVDRHGRDLHHAKSHGWLHWTGTHWERDVTGAVERCAVETVRDMYAEAANLEPAKQRQTLAAFARSSESWKRLRDMIRIAQSHESVAITADVLDCDRMLLNVVNGTVDLRSGKLREHRRGDLITRVCPVAYDPNAEASLWAKFLDDIMGGDEDLIGFLRRAAGLSLTGDTSERCLFLLHGSGRNGKSTFLAACREAMGDYALHARAETIMAKRGDSIPCDLARLNGARFVTFTETEEGKRMAVATIKEMTGGTDPITARFMRQDEFTFLPQFKPWLATNHKPVIRDQTDAIWDRIYTVPFVVRIPPEQVDKQLPKKLDGELPGILAWAVRGCLEWQRGGLQPPDKVKAATREYRAEMDTFGRWRDECCVLGDSCEANAGDLFKSYREWCESGGERWITQNAFGRRLGDDGHEKRTGRRVVYYGIGIKSDLDGGQ